MNNIYWRTVKGGLFAFLLTLCAIAGAQSAYTFSFNAYLDSPNETILDYEYGTSKVPFTRPTKEMRANEKSQQRGSVNGPMPKGEYLYVRWRNKQTRHVYEDRVDLRERLPGSMASHVIHFIVAGSQLHVYRIAPEPLYPQGEGPLLNMRTLLRSPNPDDKIIGKYGMNRITKLHPGEPRLLTQPLPSAILRPALTLPPSK